jgi:hypothetical protein
LSDEEMKFLMIDVVNQCYKFLSELLVSAKGSASSAQAPGFRWFFLSLHVPAHTRVQRCPLHIQTLIPERRSKSQPTERRTTKPHSSQTPDTHPIVRFSPAAD